MNPTIPVKVLIQILAIWGLCASGQSSAAIYVVDRAAPGAADTNPGTEEKPFKTVQHAADVARPGDTVFVMTGDYNERIKITTDGEEVRAMDGERITISGADLIEGWQREGDGRWSAPLAAEPEKLLRDGQPWGAFTYDRTAGRIAMMSGDPRLHIIETVVREQGIDLRGKQDVKVEGVTVTNVLQEAR